jgi:hypothetical protein
MQEYEFWQLNTVGQKRPTVTGGLGDSVAVLKKSGHHRAGLGDLVAYGLKKPKIDARVPNMYTRRISTLRKDNHRLKISSQI